MVFKLEKEKEPTLFDIKIDMDGVTCDLHTPWEAWIKENGDPEFSFENVLGWRLDKYTCLGEKVYEYIHLPGIYLSLKAKPGAIKSINYLKSKGHKITWCTASPETSTTAADEKVQWLKKHFDWFDPETHIIFSHDKGNVSGDILIDDRAKWCNEFSGYSICFSYSYNKHASGTHVKDWKEVITTVDRMSKYLNKADIRK